jgi:protein TonB
MFEDSFIETNKNRFTSHRGAATFLSFVLQVLVIAVLILIPLIVTQALPVAQLNTMLVAPPPPPPPPPPPASAARTVQTKPVESVTHELQVPLKIPQKVEMVKDTPPPSAQAPSVAGVVGGVAGGTTGGQIGGVIGGVIGSVPVSVPKVATPDRVRVSQGVSEGLLQHKVMPQYPPLARQARIQGQVVLQAIIGKDGKIENLQVVRGHPMLNASAIDAVKQWRYKPYMLNGQPTEVETVITVNFTMAGA